MGKTRRHSPEQSDCQPNDHLTSVIPDLCYGADLPDKRLAGGFLRDRALDLIQAAGEELISLKFNSNEVVK